jgi:hypothetical protein
MGDASPFRLTADRSGLWTGYAVKAAAESDAEQ